MNIKTRITAILRIDISPTGTFINTELVKVFDNPTDAEKFFNDYVGKESANWDNGHDVYGVRTVFTNKKSARRDSAKCIIEIKTETF